MTSVFSTTREDGICHSHKYFGCFQREGPAAHLGSTMSLQFLQVKNLTCWCFAELASPGSAGSERGEGAAVAGAAAGGDHQRGGAAGRLVVHSGRAPGAHHRRVQRHPLRPAGAAERVPALREYRGAPGRCKCGLTAASQHALSKGHFLKKI